MRNVLISVFTFHPETNGIANSAISLARGLKQRGFRVDIATTFNCARNRPDSEAEFKVFDFKIQGNGTIMNLFRGEKNSYRNFLLNSNYDLIIFYCWHSWPSELPIEYLEQIQGKKVLYSHGTLFFSKNSFKSITSIFRALLYVPLNLNLKRKLDRFDHYVFLSDSENKERFGDIMEMKKSGKTNYSVIPNTSTYIPNKPGEFRKAIGIAESDCFILHVSNYQLIKNQRRLIKNYIAADLPNSILILIGSKFNKHSRKLGNLINSSGNAKKVILLEKIDYKKIHSAYQDCDFFALSSKTEVQPLVLLDTLPYGKPFVSTDVGCIKNLSNGIVAENDSSYIRALQDLNIDKGLRHRLSENAKKEYKSTYNWEKVIDSFETLIERLLK